MNEKEIAALRTTRAKFFAMIGTTSAPSWCLAQARICTGILARQSQGNVKKDSKK